MQRRQLKRCLRSHAGGQIDHRICRLLHMHHTLSSVQRRIKSLGCPGQEWVPSLFLSLDKFLRCGGTIAKKIIFAIGCDQSCNFCFLRRHFIKSRIGRTGRWHGSGINLVALRIPFCGNSIGHGLGWDRQNFFRRRFDQTAVQQDYMPIIAALDGHGAPKSFSSPIAHRSLHRV